MRKITYCRERMALGIGFVAVLVVVLAVLAALYLTVPLVVVASILYPDGRPILLRVVSDLKEWLGVS